tara:strand:- start:301 stop:1272 length:972 start_codon:yes stop_codon:yes gene_type:complete
MSVYKPFTTSDIVLSPFEVNKSFTFQGAAALTGSGVDRFIGKNTQPSLFIPGSHTTGQISTQDKFLVYRSIRELYYSNFLEGEDGSPAGTASFNNDGTITGPAYTPNYYNYLPNTLDANRFFPTGSNDVIGVISIPSNLFGENIKPGSFSLQHNGSTNQIINITDDGEGGLYNQDSTKVGDIIYEHGMIILPTYGDAISSSLFGTALYGTALYGTTDSGELDEIISGSNITCSFESTITLYETQYKCTIRENEYNFSQNPTIISGSSNSGQMLDFATGSYFTPYVTTVGLYNNNKELVAVGKLAQPLPLSTTTDTNIIINLDM